MKKIRAARHSDRGPSRRAMGSTSHSQWLLLWATGVANADLAFLAWIGVALRSLRESLGRYLR